MSRHGERERERESSHCLSPWIQLCLKVEKPLNTSGTYTKQIPFFIEAILVVFLQHATESPNLHAHLDNLNMASDLINE